MGDNWACQTHGDSSNLDQFEMETSHVHSKYLIILIKQALFFNSKHSCQVINANSFSDLTNFVPLFLTIIQKHVARPVKFLWNTVFAISVAMVQLYISRRGIYLYRSIRLEFAEHWTGLGADSISRKKSCRNFFAKPLWVFQLLWNLTGISAALINLKKKAIQAFQHPII